jgi:hypothetical protein
MVWLHLRHSGAKSLRDCSESAVGPRLRLSDLPVVLRTVSRHSDIFRLPPDNWVGKVLRLKERVRNDQL